jgi:hypothetical protein
MLSQKLGAWSENMKEDKNHGEIIGHWSFDTYQLSFWEAFLGLRSLGLGLGTLVFDHVP